MVLPILSFLTLLSGIVLLSYLAFIFGRRLGVREATRKDREHDGPVGSHVAATLGLLAFTLAIVFNMAHEKHSGRKELVRNDALAIHTAYRRAQLLPPGEAEFAQQKIAEYAEVRALDLYAGPAPEIDTRIARSEELQAELWSHAIKNRDARDLWFYMEALNKMADAHAERVTMGVHDRIPRAVWYILALVTMFSMVAMGDQSALAGSRRAIAIIPMVFAFSLVLCVAIDLDRPRTGILRVDQGPMIRLQQTLEQR